jgi:hypothetical protein
LAFCSWRATPAAQNVAAHFDSKEEIGQTTGVFRNLTDFSYRRSPVEALGFYLVYLFVFLALSASAYFLAERVLIIGAEQALRVSLFVGGLLITFLSLLILRAKNLSMNFSLVVLAFLSGLINLAGGLLGLFGLIIPTYFSTRERR